MTSTRQRRIATVLSAPVAALATWALARAAGAASRVELPSSLLLDIDTGADLAALRERLARASTGAALTRAVLAQPERTNIKTIVNAG